MKKTVFLFLFFLLVSSSVINTHPVSDLGVSLEKPLDGKKNIHYYPEDNVIVACLIENDGRGRVSTTVIKYRDNKTFETHFMLKPNHFQLWCDGKPESYLVARLKRKINEFELTLEGSERE